MSTHNLCFGPKIRKVGIPLHTQFLYVGFEGVFIAWTSFPDVSHPVIALLAIPRLLRCYLFSCCLFIQSAYLFCMHLFFCF